MIALISLDVIRPVVFGIWQFNWRKQIRLELKKEVKKHKLINLTFSKKDLASNQLKLKFVKEDEFQFNNSMFDIVQRIETNDSITFVCFLDIKEMLYFSAIFSSKVHNGLLLPIPPILLNTFLKYYDYVNTLIPSFFFQQCISTKIILINLSVIFRNIEVPTPPPKYPF